MARDIKPSEIQIKHVFEELISDYHLYSVEKPTAIIVAGISGSGKSTCISYLLEKQAINFLPIQADDYRKLHPKLAEYRAKLGENNAHKKTGNFAYRFATELLNKATEKRFNLLFETTFGNVETTNNLFNFLQKQQYQIIVVALPANVELSILRNEKRYEEKKQVNNTLPRIVEKNVIERMAMNYQECLNILKHQNIAIYFVADFKEAFAKLAHITQI